LLPTSDVLGRTGVLVIDLDHVEQVNDTWGTRSATRSWPQPLAVTGASACRRPCGLLDRRARASTDPVLAVDRLLGHAEQGADLGPAETGMARSSDSQLLSLAERLPRVCDRRQLPHDAAVVTCPY
jgi:hypothetical protein